MSRHNMSGLLRFLQLTKGSEYHIISAGIHWEGTLSDATIEEISLSGVKFHSTDAGDKKIFSIPVHTFKISEIDQNQIYPTSTVFAIFTRDNIRWEGIVVQETTNGVRLNIQNDILVVSNASLYMDKEGNQKINTSAVAEQSLNIENIAEIHPLKKNSVLDSKFNNVNDNNHSRSYMNQGNSEGNSYQTLNSMMPDSSFGMETLSNFMINTTLNENSADVEKIGDIFLSNVTNNAEHSTRSSLSNDSNLFTGIGNPNLDLNFLNENSLNNQNVSQISKNSASSIFMNHENMSSNQDDNKSLYENFGNLNFNNNGNKTSDLNIGPSNTEFKGFDLLGNSMNYNDKSNNSNNDDNNPDLFYNNNQFNVNGSSLSSSLLPQGIFSTNNKSPSTSTSTKPSTSPSSYSTTSSASMSPILNDVSMNQSNCVYPLLLNSTISPTIDPVNPTKLDEKSIIVNDNRDNENGSGTTSSNTSTTTSVTLPLQNYTINKSDHNMENQVNNAWKNKTKTSRLILNATKEPSSSSGSNLMQHRPTKEQMEKELQSRMKDLSKSIEQIVYQGNKKFKVETRFPSDKTSTLIGTQGSNIKHIKGEVGQGCYIKGDTDRPGHFTISAFTKDAVKKAAERLIKIEIDSRIPYETSLKVEDKYMAPLVGKGYENLKRICGEPKCRGTYPRVTGEYIILTAPREELAESAKKMLQMDLDALRDPNKKSSRPSLSIPIKKETGEYLKRNTILRIKEKLGAGLSISWDPYAEAFSIESNSMDVCERAAHYLLEEAQNQENKAADSKKKSFKQSSSHNVSESSSSKGFHLLDSDDEKTYNNNYLARKREKSSINALNGDDFNSDNGQPKSYICDKCFRQVQFIHKNKHIQKCEERRRYTQDEQKTTPYYERKENVYLCTYPNCNRVIQYIHEKEHNRKYHSTEIDAQFGSTDTSTYESEEEN